MAICIKDILSLDSFENAQLISGSNHLSNVIKQVSIADTPPSEVDYIVSQRGDFYISSFFFAKDSIEDMYRFIDILVDTGACGLALINEYISILPEEITTYCSDNKLPVFILDKNVPYADIIKGITELIILDQQKSLTDSRLQSLIAGNLSIEHAINILQELNPKLHGNIISIYIIPYSNQHHESESEKILSLFNSYTTAFAAPYKGRILCLFSTTDKTLKETQKTIEYCITAVSNISPTSRIGISSYKMQDYSCSKSIKQAMFAAESILSTPANNGIVPASYYDKLGINKLLLLLDNNPEMGHFASEILKPILDYDKKKGAQLFETMTAFTETHRNYIETARRLFVHENTIRYRVDKVKGMLTEISPSDDPCEIFSIAHRIYLLMGK